MNIRRHFKPPSEREIARQQSVSERRQGANRTSSGVNLVNCRLETPPEASLTCPSAFETAAQVMHTMRVKISQDFLLQPSHAQAHLEWQREAGARTCPDTKNTQHAGKDSLCVAGIVWGHTKKRTTCGISKRTTRRRTARGGTFLLPTLLPTPAEILRPLGRGIVDLKRLCLSLRPGF